MGNCMDSDYDSGRRKQDVAPERAKAHAPPPPAQHAATPPAAAPIVPAHPAAKAEGRGYRVGEKVEACWENEWHPATIRTKRPDGAYDIDWTDGTMSYGVGPDYLRPRRTNRRSDNPQDHNRMKQQAAQQATHLFALLGGREGGTVPPDHVKRCLRDPNILRQFGWPTGRQDELTSMLTRRGSRSVGFQDLHHYCIVHWLFQVIDKDQNTRISAWELETALLQNGAVRAELGVSAEMAQPLFRQMDSDGSGWISFVEFYQFYSQHPLGRKYQAKSDETVVKRLFDRLDADRSGRVTLEELTRALRADRTVQLELGWPAHQANLLFQFLDESRTGAVSIEGLHKFIRVQLLFNRIDTNRSGFIDPYEFGEALTDPNLSAELGVPVDHAQHTFQAIDRDRSGTITFAEFFHYFSPRLGPQSPAKRHQPRPLKPSEKYETLKKLGEGTFGIVFLIRRRTDGLQLIMKKPKLVPGSSMDDVKAEAEMLSRLKHPHIVRYVESYWDNGALIIVTEFAGGGELRSQISSRGIEETKCMRWFAETCEAVKYLHDRRILHRDLKPDNIFLTAGHSVKVGDLGLATQLQHNQALAHTQCGTPVYMAPELTRGEPYDDKADIWALGCILYEMATGQMAFDTIAAIVQARAPRNAPHYCSRAVSAMLVGDPRDRPDINGVFDLIEYDYDSSQMASYMSDRYFKRNAANRVHTVSPNDVLGNGHYPQGYRH